jgi:hypothetical protein
LGGREIRGTAAARKSGYFSLILKVIQLKHALFFLFVVSASSVVVACGPSQTTTTTANGGHAGEPPIAGEWRARCASCHMRVEPGTRTRAQLEDAFTRHRTRTRMTEAQWTDLTDFLAAK